MPHCADDETIVVLLQGHRRSFEGTDRG